MDESLVVHFYGSSCVIVHGNLWSHYVDTAVEAVDGRY